MVRCNIYPKMLQSDNANMIYYTLDYHSSSGIVLGGSCNDSSICGSQTPSAIIEVFNPAAITAPQSWTKYLFSPTNDTYGILAVKWLDEPSTSGTQIAAVAQYWNQGSQSAGLTFIILSSSGVVLQALTRLEKDCQTYKQSLLFPDPNLIIFSGKINNNYATIQLTLPSSPAIGGTTQTVKYREEQQGLKNYAIIQDGQTAPGYILAGRYNYQSNVTYREGLIIWRMDISFQATWEVITSQQITSLEDSVSVLSVYLDSVYGCGKCNSCKPDDQAIFTYIQLDTTSKKPLNFKYFAIKMTDQGCLGLQGVSGNQAYGLVADSSFNYQAYLVKLDFTTTTNSGSPPTYSTSVQIKAFVGLNNLFSRQSFAVGQAIFTPSATNVWFAGYLMQTPPSLTPFPFKAGFLMTVATQDPLTLPIQTCYAYKISQGYETSMAEVLYGRTQKYIIQDSKNIDFSKMRTTQDTYTIVDISATAISKTSTYGCTSTGGSSFDTDCLAAGGTVTSKSGYKIQEVYQTGSSSATYLKTIDNTQGFNFIPEVGCFVFELYDTSNNLVSAPSCIETRYGLTTTIGLTPTNCITTTTTAPKETINYYLRASLRGDSNTYAEVPLFLELRHECYLTSLRPPNKANLTYTLNDSTLVSNNMKFTLNPTAPSCVVDYYLQENGITINNTNPNFALDIISSPPQVLVKVLSTLDLTVVGMHTLKLYGSLLTSAQKSKLSSVTISVLIVCNPISMYPDTTDYISSSPYTAKEISYTVGDPQLKIPFKEFKTSYECKQPITYSYQLEPSAPLPATVTVDNSVRQLGGGQLFVQMTSRFQVTSPRILVKITGSMQNGQFSSSLFIPISFLIPNKGPPKFSKQIADVSVKVNEIGAIQLPSVADPDSDDQYSLLSANFGAAASFITGKFPNLKISPINNSTEPGTYTATITLTDDNPQPQQSATSFKIKVLPLPPAQQLINTTVAPQNEKKTPNIKIKEGKKLTAQILSITQAGLVTIKFSSAILVPGNFIEINQTVLSIQVKPGSREIDPQDIQIIQWNVTSFTTTKVEIKVQFANPLKISLNSNHAETLEIKFLHPDFFYDKVNKQMIEQDSVIRRQIPRQMKIDSASLIFLSSAGPAQSTMSSMMYGNLAINIAMSASLQMLWGMINVMQLIVKMPLFNVTFPSNAATFYTFISDIASFDLLPMDKINSAIFHFTDEKQTDQNFNEMGYKSDNIFENLGSMVMYLLGFVLLVLFVLLIRYLKNRYVLVDKVYQYLVKLLFWNMILRMIMEGYIDYTISSILNVQNMMWETSSDRISSVFSISMLIVVLVFPFFVWALLWIKFKNLPDEETIQKYGSTYNSIRNDSKVALLYNVFYMLRRLFLALVVSFLKQVSFLQVQLMIFHSIFMIVYLQAVKPFDMPILNRMEIFNECCIMIAAYHLFTFTDFVGDPDIQYKMGWSIIVITLINVAVNMGVMFYGSFQKFKLLYRKLRYKYLQWKLSKRNKAKTEPMMNKTQIPMIKNNEINQLQVEEINAECDGLQEVSASTVSQNNNQGGRGKDNEFEQTYELDLSNHVMFKMRKQANQQFVKKVTSLDDLKREYERKMTPEEFKKSYEVQEELQYKIALMNHRSPLPQDPSYLSQILNREKEDGMKRDVPKLDIKMSHINRRQRKSMLDTNSIDDDIETGTNQVVGNIMQESAVGKNQESKVARQTTEYKKPANHSQKMADLLRKITSGFPN